MPLQKCKENNKSGWRWGEQGKCYTGPGGKKKAIKQGIAIEGPDKFKKEASKSSDLSATDRLLLGIEMELALKEWEKEKEAS